MKVDSIASSMFFSTIKLETIKANGNQFSGTTFIFDRIIDSQHHTFLVTNKHVITSADKGVMTFTRRTGDQPILGNGIRLVLSDFSETWFGHPSHDIDIAVCPFYPIEQIIKEQRNADIFYRCVPDTLIPNQSQINDLDALETVTFIGYPNSLWDQSNLLPIARRGVTATPVSVNFENTPRFLIDASVFGGSSGSPVFILDQCPHTDKHGNINFSNRCFFLGVIAGAFYHTESSEVIQVPLPIQATHVASFRQMLNIGVAFKAETVVETIDAYLTGRRGRVSAAVQDTHGAN